MPTQKENTAAMPLTRIRLLIAALLVVSAAAFAIGVAAERSSTTETHGEQHPAVHTTALGSSTSPATSGDGDGGENHPAESPAAAADSGDRPSTAGGEQPGEAARAQTDHTERLLGIDPESTVLVIIAVAVSLLLAGGVLTVRRSPLLVVVAAGMLAFAALDVREVVHQSSESRTGLAALAALVALLHLATGATAVVGWRTQPANATKRGAH